MATGKGWRIWGVAAILLAMAPGVEDASAASTVAEVRARAIAGDQNAQATLAFYLLDRETGQYAPLDGLMWLRRVVAANYAWSDGARRLGEIYLAGLAGAGPLSAPNPEDAAHWLARAAEVGDQQAISILQKLAEAGDAHAQFAYATVLLGQFDRYVENYQEVRRWLEAAASQGHVAAARAYGEALVEDGRKSAKPARKWLERAAAAGDSIAARVLAFGLLNGRLGPADDSTIRGLVMQAVRARDYAAVVVAPRRFAPADFDAADARALWAASALEGDPAVVLAHLRLEAGADDAASASYARDLAAAEAGDASAQYRAGLALAGGAGVDVDHAAARAWFEKAAGQGSGEAAYQIFRLIRSSDQGPEGEAEAQSMLARAAAAGVPAALLVASDRERLNDRDVEYLTAAALGGHSTAVDELRAVATNGDGRAQLGLATVIAAGTIDPPDQAKRTKWLRRAAEAGESDAARQLAQAYQDGEGVKADAVLSAFWRARAAALKSAE